MPYASNDDLPASLQKALPAHAQDIYRAAFNNTRGDRIARPLRTASPGPP